MDEIELDTFSLGDMTKRRCKRCKREFVGEEEWETRCYYHPGVWKEPTSDDPGWSCCRNSLMPITDFKEFFAYQESVEVPNLKDMLDEYAAKSLQQFRSVLERQRMISGPPSSDTQPLLQDHPTSRSPPPKRKYNPALAAYDYKEYNQTMSRNETFAHRADPLLSPLSRTSVGCKIADCHFLDEDFAKALQSYPLVNPPTESQPRPALPAEIVEQRLGKPVNPHNDTNMFGKLLLTNTPHREPLALPLPQQPQLPIEPTEIQNEATQQESEEDKDDQEEVPPYFIHYVQSTDTLVGLSLRYNISVDEIHRANFLTGGHQICHRQTLKIPTHGRRIGKQVIHPATPAEVIRDFRRRAPECSSYSEAKYYLEESNYDIVAALERFHEDTKWEKMNATKFQPKTITSQKPKPETSPGFSFRSMFASFLCQLGAE